MSLDRVIDTVRRLFENATDGESGTEASGGTEIEIEDGTDDEGEEETEETDTADAEPLSEISGIGEVYENRLESAGIENVSDLADADAEEVAEETGISEGRIESWIENANDY